MHGFGKQIFDNGKYIQGCFVQNEATGNFVKVYSNVHFAGSLIQGKELCGVTKYGNGDTYSGDHKNGNRHGFGIYKWTNGDVYEGLWENGDRKGYGLYYYNIGGKHEGEWKGGLRHGFGKYCNDYNI